MKAELSRLAHCLRTLGGRSLRHLLVALFVFAVLPSFAPAADNWHFRATIGVDDMVQGRPGAAVFRVFVADQKVYESPVMKAGDNPIVIHIPLRKDDMLTLEVADTGDGHGGDWGNWCDARIQDDSGKTTIWLSDLKQTVLQEWISTRKDRNIVGQPLKLQGRVYRRGLGTISGSRMRYTNWYAQWQSAERHLQDAERSAANGLRFLKLEGSLQGAQLWVNDKPVKSLPVSLPPQGTVRLKLTFGTPGWLFRHPAFISLQIRGARGTVLLREWIPDAIELCTPTTNSDLPILNGVPYAAALAPQGDVVVTYRHPFMNTASALPTSPANVRYLLRAWCAVRAVNPASASMQPTVTVRIYEGDTLRARTALLSRADGTLQLLEAPLRGTAPLRVVVEDVGDGNLGDEVYFGGTIVTRANLPSASLTSLPYLVERGGQEAVQVFHYLTSEMRKSVPPASAHTGFRLHAPAEIVFDNYPEAIARLATAGRLVREAQSLLRSGRESEAAERLSLAQRLDEGNPHVYRLRAQMAKAAGKAKAELEAWKRLVEISRADLPLRRHAKVRIAELYRRLDGGLPEFEFALPPAPPPRASINTLTERVWRLQMKPVAPDVDEQLGSLRFFVPREQDGHWLQGCIDTRGLAVNARLQRRVGTSWQTVWETGKGEPQLFPVVECQLAPGEYRLAVHHEGWRDGVDGAFHVALSLLLAPQKGASPQQRWVYRVGTDGSAEVAVSTRGALALPVPFTAEGISVEGARYSLLPPVYEYLSKLELRHAQVLLLQPHGEETTVRFRWLDAAYNVPMTRYAPDRREHFYFRSLAGLGKGVGDMEVVVHLPEGTGDIATLVPEPQTRDGSVLQFRVPQDRVVIVNAKHLGLNTRWLTATYCKMSVHIPDTPFYRRWFPEYLALLMRIYDREKQIVGNYEPEDALFVSLSGPAQLSGYGGATWGGPRSETWIACTGRVGPYNLRYESGGDGVEAHELKWVFLHGVGEGLPHWLHTGAVIYIEEQGKLAGNTAFPDVWYQRSLRPSALQFRKRFSSPPTPLQWSESDFRQQPSAQRLLGEAMANEIMQVIAQRYGNRVWAELFRRNREGKLGLKDLSDREKDARIVDTLVEIARDENLRTLFREWGFQVSTSQPSTR